MLFLIASHELCTYTHIHIYIHTYYSHVIDKKPKRENALKPTKMREILNENA